MADFTQDNKLIAILHTPLGDNDLLLRGFTGEEGISRLFRFRLDLLSEKERDDIAFKKIIGQKVTIRVNAPNSDEKRYFNGFVSRFGESKSHDQFAHYQMEVVPWLWFLTRCSDCRIFQEKTVVEIIQEVFKGHGFSDFKNQLTNSYQKNDYCVQYRETDFNFVSRLMEKYGIFYFFEHEENSHKLVLADSPSAHSDIAWGSPISYESGMGDEQVASGWESEQEIHSGKFTLSDYDFQKPSTDLKQSVPTVFEAGPNKQYESYDYPGEYSDTSVGKDLTKVRMEAAEASHFIVRGSSSCRAFTSGYKFELEDHPRSAMNGSYVITEVIHTATAGGYGSGAVPSYSNQFTCIPAKVDDTPVTFRPPQTSLRRVVHGPQSALIVGKSGEEIWVDNFGRVKVQFYWDRIGSRNEKSSCWVRVSQPWAGNGWGGMWIPRVCQEVIVSFEEGNPDRPLITGRV